MREVKEEFAPSVYAFYDDTILIVVDDLSDVPDGVRVGTYTLLSVRDLIVTRELGPSEENR